MYISEPSMDVGSSISSFGQELNDCALFLLHIHSYVTPKNKNNYVSHAIQISTSICKNQLFWLIVTGKMADKLWCSFLTCLFFILFLLLFCPVSWGCRIHQLLLCCGVRSPPKECLRYDTKQSNGGALGNVEYSFIAIAPKSIPTWSGRTWLGPINGLNRTKTWFWEFTVFNI